MARAPKLPKLPSVQGAGLGLGLLLAAGLGLWLERRGAAGVGQDVGAAVVDAAGGVVSGAVGAVSQGIGIPTPAQTTTDAAVARWIADNHGWLAASLWSGAPALFAASGMPPGSGKPPTPGSPAGMALGVTDAAPGLTSGDFARMDRAALIEQRRAQQAYTWGVSAAFEPGP